MSLTYRDTKGSELEHNEVDENFRFLDQKSLAYEVGQIYRGPVSKIYNNKLYILNAALTFPYTTTNFATELAAGNWSLVSEEVDLSQKADLVDGKVPASQLPSYVDANGDATFTKQVVAKPDGTLGLEDKTLEETIVYTEANCIVDTSLVETGFKFIALKKGREFIINMIIELKSSASSSGSYFDLVTLPTGINVSGTRVLIGQRWQVNNEVSTVIISENKIRYFGANHDKLKYSPVYFNAVIIID